ncbi:MAG: inositol monophosphatase family protein [Methanoregula sp.]
MDEICNFVNIDELSQYIQLLGNELKEVQKSDIILKNKTKRDIVTNLDIEIERKIITFILLNYPTHKIYSEETFNKRPTSSSDYIWVIDPIDGTINFNSGLPFYSISVALIHNNEPQLGIIYAPALNELYTVVKNKGSYLNYKPIKCSEQNTLKNGVFSFTLTSHYSKEETDKILQIVRDLSLKSRGLRLFVSTALELGYVASGRLDGFILIKSRGISSSAGALLVREAGGIATDFAGTLFSIHSKNLIASNAKMHNSLINYLKNKV